MFQFWISLSPTLPGTDVCDSGVFFFCLTLNLLIGRRKDARTLLTGRYIQLCRYTFTLRYLLKSVGVMGKKVKRYRLSYGFP